MARKSTADIVLEDAVEFTENWKKCKFYLYLNKNHNCLKVLHQK